MGVGLRTPFSKPFKSPRSARGQTKPPPRVLVLPEQGRAKWKALWREQVRRGRGHADGEGPK
eukprot:2875996-Pleurochrysis_carterae.AAC.1